MGQFYRRLFERKTTEQNLRPVLIFSLLSILFGAAISIITPPLRGPDESAHFLRAYGIARGDIVPSIRDQESKKGVFLSADLYDGFAYFDALQSAPRASDFNYRSAINDYWNSRAAGASSNDVSPVVFVRYAGSEGYSPAPYLPHIAAAGAARLMGLEFLGTLYLMRLAGLLVMTMLIAYALAILPRLVWGFALIALIPAALYGRAVINADGGVLAYTMVVVAVWVRATVFPEKQNALRQTLWLCLCALSKPPQIVFVLLQPVTKPLRNLVRSWPRMAAVVLPALILSIAWLLASAGDLGAWRLVELTGIPPEQFSPAWKLRFMLQNPSDFPQALFGTLGQIGELWRQLIGVLGLFDTVLATWAYPLLTTLLLGSWTAALELSAPVRRRLAWVAGVTAAAYSVAICMIFYLVWTPIRSAEIWGVQGRYFIPALPLCALALASVVNRNLPVAAGAVVSVLGAILSGLASVEAILRVDWKW
jgi:uncharacterized membrane protein